MRFAEAVKKGISGVQSAYSQQKRAAEERAERRMRDARTRYEKERIKAELEREKLVLERQMYEAKAAVAREREAVAEAKRKAGKSGGFARFVSETGKSFRQIGRDIQGSPPKKRRTATKKRVAAKRR